MLKRFYIGSHRWSEGGKCRKGGYFLTSDPGIQQRIQAAAGIGYGIGYRYRPAMGIDTDRQWVSITLNIKH